MLDKHQKIERHSLALVVMIMVVASLGGLFEIGLAHFFETSSNAPKVTNFPRPVKRWLHVTGEHG